MKALLLRLKEEGGAKEVHVRVACPPIVAPCYYGIDMSKIKQLFAPNFFSPGGNLDIETQEAMADALGCDSLRYLPIESIARAIGIEQDGLCQACINCEYPTDTGKRLYQLDRKEYEQMRTAGIASTAGESTDDDSRAFERTT